MNSSSSSSVVGVVATNSSTLHPHHHHHHQQQQQQQETHQLCDHSLLFTHLRSLVEFDEIGKHLSVVTSSLFDQPQAPHQQQQQQHNSWPPVAADAKQQQYELQQEQQRFALKMLAMTLSLLIGMFYATLGYRFLRVSTFITSFALGFSLVYVILIEQRQLAFAENLSISMLIGVLLAIIGLMLPYIGLFLLGITSSISLVTCALILVDLFYANKSAWLCIVLVFVCTSMLASLTLRFQRSLTIWNTSSIGCGLLLLVVDFVVENNLLLDYVLELYRVNGNSYNSYERQKALLAADMFAAAKNTTTFASATPTPPPSTSSRATTTTTIVHKSLDTVDTNGTTTIVGDGTKRALALFLHLYSSANERLCWYTWLVFASFFAMLLVSLLFQFLVTARNHDHRGSFHKRTFSKHLHSN